MAKERHIREEIRQAKRDGKTELNITANSREEIKEICTIRSLKNLTLKSGNLETLPEEIGDLINLKVLDLSGNYLTRLPEQIGTLKNLERLHLYRNQLKFLSVRIGELKKLKKLILWSNKLTGLPATIGQLENLEELDLTRNELEKLPQAAGQLKKLKALVLEDNNLKKLPKNIDKLKNLIYLNLNNNEFREFPKALTGIKKLEYLFLGGNYIAELPEEMGNMTNLEVLYLGNESKKRNQIRALPIGFYDLKNISKISLSGNKLTAVSKDFGKLKKLTVLDLQENPIKKIPPDVIAEGKKAIFIHLGLAEPDIYKENIALKKDEIDKINKQYKGKIDDFIRCVKGECDDDKLLNKLLDFITAKTDVIPAGKPEDCYSLAAITEILAPYEKWTFIDRRILAFITQEAWCYKKYEETFKQFSDEGYHEGFYKWLKKEIRAEKNDNLFLLVIEELKTQAAERFALSDKYGLYKVIRERNHKLKRCLERHLPEVLIRNQIEMLQQAVDVLLRDSKNKIAIDGPLYTLPPRSKREQKETKKSVMDEDQIIRHCLDKLRDVLLTEDKKPTSAGKYLLSKFPEKSDMMLKATKHIFELLVIHKNEEFDEYLTERLFIVDKNKEAHAKYSKLDILCKYNAEKYEQYVLKSLEITNCQPCKAELGKILKHYFGDKYNELSFGIATDTLNYIAKKKERTAYDFPWSDGKSWEDGTPRFMEWIIKAFGKKAKGIISKYLENTKVRALDVSEVVAKYICS